MDICQNWKEKFMICSIVERIEFSKIQTEYI